MKMEGFDGGEKKNNRLSLLKAIDKFARHDSSIPSAPIDIDIDTRPFKKGARNLLAGGLMLASQQQALAENASSGQLSKEPVTIEESDYMSAESRRTMLREQGREVLSEDDIKRLTASLYYEAQGEPVLGQEAVLQVHLARLISGKFGKSLKDVIYAKKQFSWTADKETLNRPVDHKVLDTLHALVSSLIDIKSPEQVVAELSKITGLPEDCIDYKDHRWDENNPHEKRMSEKNKEYWRTLIPLPYDKRLGTHQFYLRNTPPSKVARSKT